MVHQHEHLTIGRLRGAFAASAALLAAELAGGLAAHSLALLADAGHMLIDMFSLGLAWFAAEQALRPADFRWTYGYQRSGILVALVNAAGLLAITVFIAFEAYHRLLSPEPVNSNLMLIVAAAALVINAAVAGWLAQAGSRNLNVKSALLHIVGDAAASAGVLVAGATITITGIWQIDPLASVLVALLICLGAWHIISQTIGILMEAAPRGFDMGEVVRQILRVAGVYDVHDLHVWSISNEVTALSCHVLMDDQRTSEVMGTLEAIKHMLRDRFGIVHATIEVECVGCVAENAYCSQLDDDGHLHGVTEPAASQPAPTPH